MTQNDLTPAAPTSAGPPSSDASPTSTIVSTAVSSSASTPPPTSSSSPTSLLLAGHIGHLTDAQEQAFATFKKELASRNLYTSDPEPSADDGNLLRFLRARKFDVPAAIEQFSTADAWRKQIRLEELYDDYDIVEFEEAKRVNPIWTGRRNKAGQPVYVFRVSDLNKKVGHQACYVSLAKRIPRRL